MSNIFCSRPYCICLCCSRGLHHEIDRAEIFSIFFFWVVGGGWENKKDPTSQLVTTLRNAYLARKYTCHMPDSKWARNVLRLLTREGFVAGYSIHQPPVNQIVIFLRYSVKKKKLKFLHVYFFFFFARFPHTSSCTSKIY